MKTNILNTFSKEDIQNQFVVLEEAYRTAFDSEKAKLDSMINRYNKTANPENKIEIDSGIMKQTGENSDENEAAIIRVYKKGIYNKNVNIPTCKEVCERLSNNLNEVLESCPSPEDRMTNLVNDLTDNIDIFKNDDWKKDTLRLRILKQFIKYGNGLQYSIEGENDKAKGKTVHIVRGMEHIRKYVQQKMAVEELKEKKGQNSLNEWKQKKLSDIKEDEILEYVDDHIFAVLDKQYRKEETKRFLGDDHLDDDVFSRLDREPYKDQTKPDGLYGLLRVANDLASGQFGKNTKQYLYLFALVFGMSYSSEEEKEEKKEEGKEEEKYDVKTRLFDKYYLDEPLRHPGCGEIRDMGYDGRHDNGIYWPPSGQGINPKDFKDVIYLYYLHSPFEDAEGLKARVQDADQMIRRVTKDKKADKPEIESHRTFSYLYSIMPEVMKIESKEDLEEYINDHYCVDETQKQNSAFYEYKKYIFWLSELSELANKVERGNKIDVNEKLENIKGALTKLKKKETGLEIWFRQLLGENKKQNEIYTKREDIEAILGGGLCIKNSEKDEKKSSIIDKTGEMFGSKIIEKPEDMTRSALVGAYYFCFVNAVRAGLALPAGFHEKQDAFITGRIEGVKIFPGFSGIDKVLEYAWYAPMDSNNMFDSLVMLSIASL